MAAEILTLPDHFNIGTNDFLIYVYSTNKPSQKNKVIFTKNMLCLLQHGTKEVLTAGGKQILHNDELLMLPSGTALMSESISINNKYEAILIFFGNDTLIDFCTKQKINIKRTPLKPSVLKVRRDDFLNNYCHSLKLLQKQRNNGIDKFKVYEIIGYLNSMFPDAFSEFIAQALADKKSMKVKQVVDVNLNKGLSIEELAFLCDMSISTFKRYFAKTFHMTPKQYFVQTKMTQARALLSLRRRPSEIYGELGYENLSAFSNEFKKHFGISPRELLEKNELSAK